MVDSSSSSTRSTKSGHGEDIESQQQLTVIQATWVHKAAFCVLGIADLFFWNCVLNILYDIRDKVYPDYPSMTDTLNAVNIASTLLVAVYTVKTGAMNLNVTVLAGAVLSVACLLTAVTVQAIPGVAGIVVLHLANCIAGACSGFYQTGGCGLASVIGEGGLSGYVSTGQGITGFLTFGLWELISHSNLQVRSQLWVLMSCGMAVTLASSLNFFRMSRHPEIARRAAEVRKSLKEEATNPDAPSYRFLAKRVWLPMLSVFWSFYITLFFFPNVGPLNWGDGDFSTYGIGCFQIGDMIGRYLPVLLPFLKFKLKTSAYIVLARTIFLPLAFLCWYYPTNAFWGNNAWHMVLIACLSISNGWMASCIWMDAPSAVPQKDWRSRAMNLVVLSTLTGIAGGLWSARIFTAIAI